MFFFGVLTFACLARIILYMVLFKIISYCIAVAIGISAVFLGILAPELETWYRNRIFLAEIQIQIDNTKDKLSEFDDFISKASSDEEIIKILYESQLGLNPDDTEEMVYPAVDISKRCAAQEALTETLSSDEDVLPEIPQLVSRVNQPHARMLLIVSGVTLIVFAYVYVIGSTRRRKSNAEKKI